MDGLLVRYVRQLSRDLSIRNFGRICQISNGICYRLMIHYVNAAIPRRLPRKIQIEPTSRCNLQCLTCSHSRETDSGQHLKPDELVKILDRLPLKPTIITLSGTGEPLCNPDFFELVDILAGRGIQCQFYTNGTLLMPRMRTEILSRASISSIGISCDSARKETFEALRVGADFETWKQYVRDFLTEARQGRPICIEMMSVLSKQNLNEIEDTMHFAANLGFECINFLDAIPIDDVAASLCTTRTDLSKLNEKGLYMLGKKIGLDVSFSWMRRRRIPPKSIVRCIQPWEYMQVRIGGDIVPCCALFGTDKLMVMGNLLQQEFEEIWHGTRFRDFRQTCASGRNALCKVCTFY